MSTESTGTDDRPLCLCPGIRVPMVIAWLRGPCQVHPTAWDPWHRDRGAGYLWASTDAVAAAANNPEEFR